MTDETCPLCGGPAINCPDGTVVYVTPTLMGAKDVAEMLGIKVPNLKHVKIEPVARISGGAIPVYLRADVEAEKERKAQARRAAASE